MALARFKDLCLDAADPARLGSWWAAVLGLHWDGAESGGGRIVGATPHHTIWLEQVPEPKTVKHRVHLDIYTANLPRLLGAGATVVEAQHDDWGWTVMADPEGGEFCAFVRDEVPDDRVHGLVVDSVEPATIAAWWAEVYGADLIHHPEGYSTVENVPGMPILTMDFVPVSEPKTAKNRIHWDVNASSVEALVAVGASTLRPADDEIGWTVLADPEGNEFCVFTPAVTGA